MEKFPVIILQTSPEGFSLCREDLLEAGLIEGEDFIMCSTLPSVRLLFKRLGDKSGLLVMGTINGAIDLADEFAREVAQSFSSVKIAWFSIDRPLEPPYFKVVPKGAGNTFAGQLVTVIQEFSE